MEGIDDLLYDVVNRERNLEIERKERLETKAQRFTTFGGIFVSIISTYFFFLVNNTTGNPIPIYLKWILIISICLFGISIFLFLLSMRTMRDVTFDAEKLVTSLQKDSLNTAKKRIIGNLIQYMRVIRATNNHKAELLFYGIILFFSGLFVMILGILTAIFIV